MSTIDYNTDNYTISEMLAVIDLDDPTEEEIVDTTNKYIDRFSKEGSANLTAFFQDIQTKLLEYVNQLETAGDANDGDGDGDADDAAVGDLEYQPNSDQTDRWFKNQALPQDEKPVQKDKNTERKEQNEVYDNNHVPMKKEQLGINNNFSVPVAQDTLNPNLTNITSRFINLDSQFRQAAGGVDTIATDYTLDLSDPLTNVLSLRLYSIQIPFTWYVIDEQFGNTCFWVTNTDAVFKIFIAPGNYNSTTLCDALDKAFTTDANFSYPNDVYFHGFQNATIPPPLIATYNAVNGRITINLEGWTDPANNPIISITQNVDTFDASIDAYFTFFDFTGRLKCFGEHLACAVQNIAFNGTLGWVMGYRLPIVPVFKGGNTAIAVLDLYGPKYFILVLDDYNQNHINNGLITITELSTKLAIPSYYNTSQPYICSSNVSNINPLLSINSIGNLPNQNITGLQDKLDFSYGKIQTILPSAPRTLTQAQIYTVNEIMKNREKNTSYRGKAPTSSDTFALIPVKRAGLNTGDMYVDFSGSIQDNKRIYFGPVDIDRMRIKLLDDRGFIVDLHGQDWCITLISENLYQY
jgi:hypothetical protein